MSPRIVFPLSFLLIILLIVSPSFCLLRVSNPNTFLVSNQSSGKDEFTFVNATITVEDINGLPVGDAEVSAFSEEWGVVYPNRWSGQRTNDTGMCTFSIPQGNWSFFASASGYYVILTNVTVVSDDLITLRPNATIQFSIYDVDSKLLDGAEVYVADSDHVPILRTPFCGIVTNGSFVLYVTQNRFYEIVLLRPVVNETAFLFHISKIEPGFNVVFEPKREELALVNFSIVHEDGTFMGLVNLVAKYSEVSLEAAYNLFDIKGRFVVYMTPEHVKFEVLDHTNGSTFCFFDEDFELESNTTYDMFYGGSLDSRVWFYPEIFPWDKNRQFWIQITDSDGHYLRYFYDARQQAHYQAPIKIVDPLNESILYEGKADWLFIGEVPFDPSGYEYQVHLDFDYFGVYDLTGNVSSYDFVLIHKAVTEHFSIEYPAIFPQYLPVQQFAEQAYELMSSEMGFSADPKPPDADGKIRVLFPFVGGGWACGATMGVCGNCFVGEGSDLSCPTWGFQAIFLHELSHIFRGTALTNYWPAWYNEDHAETMAIFVFADIYGKKEGLYIRSIYSNAFFDHLYEKTNADFSDRFMFVLFYLHDRYGEAIHKDFTQIWANETRNAAKKQLSDAGFNENETIAVLYSFLAKENLAWLFQLVGLDVSEQRVIEGLSLIETNIIDHIVQVDGRAFHVVTESNSTVSNLVLDQSQIEFNISGDSGDVGYCNVTIPKSLMNCTTLNDWVVWVNSTQLSPPDLTATENATHTFIYFTCTFASLLQVTIKGTYVVPEFSSPAILLLSTATTLLAIIVHRRRHGKR